MQRNEPGWQWIDDNGLLHCPICRTLLTPQNRKDRSNFAWNVGNVKRHLDAHSLKCKQRNKTSIFLNESPKEKYSIHRCVKR